MFKETTKNDHFHGRLRDERLNQNLLIKQAAQKVLESWKNDYNFKHTRRSLAHRTLAEYVATLVFN